MRIQGGGFVVCNGNFFREIQGCASLIKCIPGDGVADTTGTNTGKESLEKESLKSTLSYLPLIKLPAVNEQHTIAEIVEPRSSVR